MSTAYNVPHYPDDMGARAGVGLEAQENWPETTVLAVVESIEDYW